jgi:short-subunit dehydrogenase
VTDAGAVEKLVREVADEHGRLDFMFNNAGIAVIGDAGQMSLEHWNRLVDVNIRGVMYGTVAAYARMRTQGHGHIVNTASMAGLIPTPQFTAYAMTKHAVVGLSQSLRMEAVRYGVRVSVVCPGIIDTAMAHNAEVVGGIDRERMKKEVPVSFYPAADCARDVLHGVEKNRAVIVVTNFAKAVCTFYRLAPSAARALIGGQINRRAAKSEA